MKHSHPVRNAAIFLKTQTTKAGVPEYAQNQFYANNLQRAIYHEFILTKTKQHLQIQKAGSCTGRCRPILPEEVSLQSALSSSEWPGQCCSKDKLEPEKCP